jgi:hypothetical protein
MITARAANTCHLICALQKSRVIGLICGRYGMSPTRDRRIDRGEDRNIGADKPAQKDAIAAASRVVGCSPFRATDCGIAASAITAHPRHFSNMLIDQGIVELSSASFTARTRDCGIGGHENSGSIAADHTDAQSHSATSC